MATTVKITELPIATTVDESAVFVVNDTSTNTTKQISKENLFTQLELDIENYLTDGVRSVVPNLDDTYDLGSSVKKWRDVYVSGDIVAGTFSGDGSGLTNLPISAVGGSAVLSVTPSSLPANHSVLFTLTNSGTDSVNTDPGLLYNPSTNTLTAGSFIGDAQGMTNRVDSSGIISLLSTGVNDILPASDSAYNLGSPTKKWKDLYLSGSTIYIGGQRLSVDGSGNLKFNDSDVTVGTSAAFDGQFEDGSISSPSITFANDNDTGFFRSANNIIGFTSAGVSRGFEFGPSYLYLTKGILGTGDDYLRSDMLLPRFQMNIEGPVTNYGFLTFSVTNSQVGSIAVTGSSTAYNTSSDYRLKENIVPIENAITRVNNLNPIRFNFTMDPNRTVDGFLAHEVSPVVPESISGEKDAVDSDGNPIYQGIDQSKLVPLLVAAIKELKAELDDVKAQLGI